MNEELTKEEELARLYNERANLIIAYQEMAEAARRLEEGFFETIKEHGLRMSYHRFSFRFYEDTKKKCEALLKDIL